jgi:hypothetical protein
MGSRSCRGDGLDGGPDRERAEGASALDRAIEAVVGTIGRFSGKNATSSLEAYRAKMVMRDITEDRRLSGFPRVTTPGIHAEVLEVREESRT